ncbi:mobilization protein, partial [Staphylococcus saprophyticus]
MSLQDKIKNNESMKSNENQTKTVNHQHHNKSGTNSQQTHINSNVIENLQKQNDLLMKRLVEIEKRENEREQRHNKLLASLEVSTSNFNKATENTKDNFMTVASSYLRKIKDDN